MDDLLTRYLKYTAAVLFIAVAVVLFLLVRDVFVKPEIPRSPAEREYMIAKSLAEKKPNDVDYLLRLARAELDVDKDQDAVDHVKQAIKLAKNGPMLNYTLGQAYMKLGMIKEATDAFKKELEVTKDRNELALYDLGRIYKDQRDYKKAIAVLIKAVGKAPGMADAHLVLAQCYEETKQRDAAIRAYTTALQYIPDMEEAVEGLKRLGAVK